jgi:hypothetical protein
VSKRFWVCLSAVALLASLVAAPLLPARVLAASATLTVATPLHDSPTPDATVLTLLPEGSVVVIDGPPVDGFYPVTTGDLSGWMRGETLLVEKDEGVTGSAENPAPDAPGDVPPGDQPAADAAAGTAPIVSDAAVPSDGAAPAETIGVASGELALNGEPVLATDGPAPEPLAPADVSGDSSAGVPTAPAALVTDPTLDTAPVAAADPVFSPDAAATPVPVEVIGELPIADSGVVDPATTSTEPPLAFPDAGPLGPASLTAETPILLGPGSEFGQITTAPAGSAVEQTGHLIDGYVTVRYGGVTGWVSLVNLGPPAPVATEAPAATSAEPVNKTQPRNDRRRPANRRR